MSEPITTGSRSDERLFDAWLELRRTAPQLRARDAAAALGVSEVEIVAAGVSRGETVSLTSDPTRLLRAVAELGPVTAHSGSGQAVLECNGTYGAPDIGEHTGIVIGDNIDLRIFPSGWRFAYAVSDRTERGLQRSLQVFDAEGTAVHKIFLRPESDVTAFDRLVATLAAPSGGESLRLEQEPLPADDTSAAVDVAAYRAAFAGMQDTHDFFMLLRRFGVARENGLRLAGENFALPLLRDAHRRLFAHAAEKRIPLMLFVANEGIVQISSGPIPQPVLSAPWCNLLDPRFNLHVNEDGIARAWAVRKPTVKGIVTSLELYDAGGTLCLQVFGERHEGVGERSDWAAAIARLEPLA